MLGGFGRRTSLEILQTRLWEFKIPLFFLFWIGLGWVISCAWWKFTIVEGIYFAITACSTGGLQVPEKSNGATIFTGFYLLIGIPLYALSLTTAAAYGMQFIVASRVEA